MSLFSTYNSLSVRPFLTQSQPTVIIPFIAQVNIRNVNHKIALTATNSLVVNWGDSTTTSVSAGFSGSIAKTYSTTGIKTITITGSSWGTTDSGFNPSVYGLTAIFDDYVRTNNNLITNIIQWGNNKWTSLYSVGAFYDGNSYSATDIPDLSAGPTLYSAFGATYSLNDDDYSKFNGNIANWDVSKVSNMEAMFNRTNTFNQPIGSWDTSNVRSLGQIFRKATAFNQDISGWNTSNVTIMVGMFQNATSFNCGQASGVAHSLMNRTASAGWRTGNVVSNGPDFMFNNATAWNGDISEWCVTNITSIPTNFAQGATNWQTAGKLPNWGTCPIP